MKSPSYEEELKQRDVRQKYLESIVASSLADVESKLLKSDPRFHHTTFFGAMGIDPKHLSIWCFFKKDLDLEAAESNGFTTKINDAVRDSLIRNEYPASVISRVYVSFATDEDVQRTCDGNYWHYLK